MHRARRVFFWLFLRRLLLLRWVAIRIPRVRSSKSFDWHAVACKLTTHCNAATKWGPNEA